MTCFQYFCINCNNWTASCSFPLVSLSELICSIGSTLETLLSAFFSQNPCIAEHFCSDYHPDSPKNGTVSFLCRSSYFSMFSRVVSSSIPGSDNDFSRVLCFDLKLLSSCLIHCFANFTAIPFSFRYVTPKFCVLMPGVDFLYCQFNENDALKFSILLRFKLFSPVLVRCHFCLLR